MITRSFGAFVSFANSLRTSSRRGVAAVAWLTSNENSRRWSSGFGFSSRILISTAQPPRFHLRDQLAYMFLRTRIDADERGPLTRDSIYNGGPGGERFYQRERAQVLFSVDLEEPPARRDQVTDRVPQRLREEPGRVAHLDPSDRGERAERVRVDRLVALGLEIDDPDEGGMPQLKGPLGDPVPAGAERRQFPDTAVGLRTGVDRSVPLGELRAQGVGDGPGRLVTWRGARTGPRHGSPSSGRCRSARGR